MGTITECFLYYFYAACQGLDLLKKNRHHQQGKSKGKQEMILPTPPYGSFELTLAQKALNAESVPPFNFVLLFNSDKLLFIFKRVKTDSGRSVDHAEYY